MDHGTRDKSARLILASVPVQALLMAGVLALALGGRSAAPAPDGAYFVKPAPAQGPAVCKAVVDPSTGQIIGLTGPAADGSQIDSKVVAIGAARCAIGSIDGPSGLIQPGKPLPPAPPAKP
jgi:hypothetical protein